MPDFVILKTRPALISSDLQFFGAGQVSGTTANVGTPSNLPVRRRVRVHRQDSGRPLREVWSDRITGAYEFKELPLATLFVLAFDHTGEFGGVIETDIVAGPMP